SSHLKMLLVPYMRRNIGLVLHRRLASSARPFPVLEDPLSSANPSLTSGCEQVEEQLAQLNKLKQLSHAGGGEKGLLVHSKKNKKLYVRERLRHILDEDADFIEIGLLAGLGLEYGDVPGSAVICGIGKIHGRYCSIIASDATQKGGAMFPVQVQKCIQFMDKTEKNLLPSLYLTDSGGAALPLQSQIFPDKRHGGRGFRNEAWFSAMGIPQVSIICGSCTAGGAYQPLMADDCIMVDGIATMFLGGPPLVKAALGEEVSAEELGGAMMHNSASGCVDYFAGTEEESFEMARDLMATVKLHPATETWEYDEPTADLNDLNVLCGNENIDRQQIYGIIARIVDGGRFREFKKMYGANLTVGYAMIEGQMIGLVANAGPLTYKDGLKGSHFIQNCQQRGLPIIFLQNSGSLPSCVANHTEMSALDLALTMKSRGSMIAALSTVTVPKITVNVGNCHGDDNYTMCGLSFDPDFILSWPGTSLTQTLNPTPVPPQPKPESKEGNKPAKKRRTLSAFNFPTGSALDLAGRSLYDDVIIPSDTRKIVSHCLRITAQKSRLVISNKEFPVFRL
ncbi:unnamed protein product, partial [Meganyctiphanes norvegica]